MTEKKIFSMTADLRYLVSYIKELVNYSETNEISLIISIGSGSIGNLTTSAQQYPDFMNNRDPLWTAMKKHIILIDPLYWGREKIKNLQTGSYVTGTPDIVRKDPLMWTQDLSTPYTRYVNEYNNTILNCFQCGYPTTTPFFATDAHEPYEQKIIDDLHKNLFDLIGNILRKRGIVFIAHQNYIKQWNNFPIELIKVYNDTYAYTYAGDVSYYYENRFILAFKNINLTNNGIDTAELHNERPFNKDSQINRHIVFGNRSNNPCLDYPTLDIDFCNDKFEFITRSRLQRQIAADMSQMTGGRNPYKSYRLKNKF